MTKKDFLEGLRKALANDLSGSIIQENVDYYHQYINDEMRKGKSEEEVVAELGDPWAIAQTIIDSVEIQGNAKTQEGYGYEPGPQAYEQQKSQNTQVHVFGLDSWWKVLLLVLGIIGIFALVIVVVGGIFSLLAPILVPLIIIAFIFRLLGRRR